MADIFLEKLPFSTKWGCVTQLTVCEVEQNHSNLASEKIKKRASKKIRSRIEKHQVLTVSPEKDIEIVQIQDRYEVAMAQREALQLQLYIAYLLILLILVTGGIIVWFRRRIHQQLTELPQATRGDGAEYSDDPTKERCHNR